MGPEDYESFNPGEMMGHTRPHHSGGGGGIIGPEDYGEYDPQTVPHRTSAIDLHHQHGAGGDTYTPSSRPPGWAMPEGGQTADAYPGTSYQAPYYNPCSSLSLEIRWSR